jgi:hypothetical protein
VASGLLLLGACGGEAPSPSAPAQATLGAPGAPHGAAPNVGDAGPSTTTTDTLGAGGGTKLTPLAAADAGAGPKQHGEIGRTVADLRAIMAAHRDEARACYDNALAAHPSIEGTIDLRWLIDPGGAVTEADIDTSHSEIVEPAVATCLIAMVKRIHFNASAKGFETKAHYPFNFHPHTKSSVNPN